MKRRHFLRTGGAAALALSGMDRYGQAFADTHLRVGLIGTGWYGKGDLFRLLQVAPVDVVSLCDVDSAMLADAAEQVAARQESRKTPRTFADYRRMLAQRDLDLVIVATPDHAKLQSYASKDRVHLRICIRGWCRGLTLLSLT